MGFPSPILPNRFPPLAARSRNRAEYVEPIQTEMTPIPEREPGIPPTIGVRRAQSWLSVVTGNLNRQDDVERSPDETKVEKSISDAKRDLRTALVGTDCHDLPDQSLYDESVAWYMSRIETQVQSLPPEALKGYLVPGRGRYKTDEARPYEFLACVARGLKVKNTVSIGDIVDKMWKDSIVYKYQDFRQRESRIVFIVLGWITMLYKPSTAMLDSDILAIEDPRGRKFLKSNRVHIKKLDQELVDHRFASLLRSFGGRLIPQTQKSLSSSCLGHGYHQKEWLKAANISYYHLNRILRIKIEFVDVLHRHLEFDASQMSLKIFRFPSLCRVVYGSGDASSLLCRLFQDDAELDTIEGAYTKKKFGHDSDALKFCRELLITYRIIFGHDKMSMQRFTKQWRKKQFDILEENQLPEDPLLSQICGYPSPSASALYHDVLEFDFGGLYSYTEHFPIFGARLLRLHQFSEEQTASDLRTLFRDRRDMFKWVTYWLALVTLMITVIVSIIPIFLNGFQLKAQNDQNKGI